MWYELILCGDFVCFLPLISKAGERRTLEESPRVEVLLEIPTKSWKGHLVVSTWSCNLFCWLWWHCFCLYPGMADTTVWMFFEVKKWVSCHIWSANPCGSTAALRSTIAIPWFRDPGALCMEGDGLTFLTVYRTIGQPRSLEPFFVVS